MLRLEVEQVGRPEWPRWIIKDSHGQVYRGCVWSRHRKEAWLFADRSLAETTCSKLQADNTLQMFEVQVHLLIEVQSHSPLSLDDLKEYMSQHARFDIDQPEDHDCTFASFHTVIDWDSMQG